MLGNNGGRPRKPTALKVLEGTDRPDRINDDEPKPAVGRPTCPPWVSAKARKHWRRIGKNLESMHVLTVVDDAGLGLLSDALADYIEAGQEVERRGLLIEEERYDRQGNCSTMLKANPAVAMKSDAWRRVFMLLTQYGLTAASRGKVKAEKPPERDEFSEMFG